MCFLLLLFHTSGIVHNCYGLGVWRIPYKKLLRYLLLPHCNQYKTYLYVAADIRHAYGYSTVHSTHTCTVSVANTTPTCTAQLIWHTYTAQPTKVPVAILLTVDDAVIVTVTAFSCELCLTVKSEAGTISGGQEGCKDATLQSWQPFWMPTVYLCKQRSDKCVWIYTGSCLPSFSVSS